VLSWIAAGATLFVLARKTRHLPAPVAEPVLAGGSGLLSAIVAGFFTPAYVTVLFTLPLGFLFSQMVTAACAAAMGGIFGRFLLPRVRLESLRNSPMRWGHWIALTVWILFFTTVGQQTHSAIVKLNAVDDPNLYLVMASWQPGEEPVQEQTFIRGGPHFLTDKEVRELQAEGLTGIVMVGATGAGPPDRRKIIRPQARFVIVMTRATRETIDLPKPQSGDILYIQTETGWKRIPASAPTVERTVRLKYFDPDAEHKLPSTRVDVDEGLGHSDSGTLPWFITPREWAPDAWQTPLPSLTGPAAEQ
jgi:hypothetical protein